MARLRTSLIVLVTFAALAAVLTYPQVRHLGTSVPFHPDPYFSMWRLNWVAHALVEHPTRLFEANIFYPAHDTLAYSDAMLLPGILLAPLFLAGVNAVAVYNVTLLGAMVLSALAAFALARTLTNSVPAGIVAGTIYAFAPYRFDHYMHLELQIVFWVPVGLIAVHRISDTARLRDGLGFGAMMVAQAFSCLYIALFFTAYCAVFIPALWLVRSGRSRRLGVAPLAVAAGLTLAAVSPYALVYARASRSVGTRTRDDVQHYGSTVANFAAAPPMNRLYGASTSGLGADELYLFPGVAAIALAVVGAVASRARPRLAYLAALAAVWELSRGFNGTVYPWLFSHVMPLHALRSPARIGILANLSLAVLSAYGVSWILARVPPRRRAALSAAVVLVLAAEYASAPDLAGAPSPGLVDTWLSRQPPAVLVELPLASPDTGWHSQDFLFMYQGLGHRQRMINGYSGFPPGSYYDMLEEMRTFPDDRSMRALAERHVDYVVLRGGTYRPERWTELVGQVSRRGDLTFVGGFPGGERPDLVYRIAVGAPPASR
jgi:hypothetical protein